MIKILNALSPLPKIAKARPHTCKAKSAENITSTPYKKAMEDKASAQPKKTIPRQKAATKLTGVNARRKLEIPNMEKKHKFQRKTR